MKPLIWWDCCRLWCQDFLLLIVYKQYITKASASGIAWGFSRFLFACFEHVMLWIVPAEVLWYHHNIDFGIWFLTLNSENFFLYTCLDHGIQNQRQKAGISNPKLHPSWFLHRIVADFEFSWSTLCCYAELNRLLRLSLMLHKQLKLLN